MGRMMRLIRFWLSHREVERDLAEELDLHRDLMQERLERNGLSREDSLRASRRAMGNVTMPSCGS